MALAGYKASVYVTSTPSVALPANDVLTDAGDHKTFNEAVAAHVAWDKATAFTVQAEADEVQTVTITGSPTGGTFTLTFGGVTSATLNWNATAAQVQSALQALTSIGANNALVTGGPGPGTPFTVEFVSTLGFASQALITLSNNLLTGGTSPSVSITRAQAGFTWTIQASGFVINYPIGQVLFTAAFLGTQAGCRITVGNYYPFSFLANAKQVDITPAVDVVDVTTFQTPASPWKLKLGMLAGSTVKLSKYWVDISLAQLITNTTLLILIAYSGQNANQRYAGYVKMKQDAHKFAVNIADTEDLDFEVDGQLYFIAA